MIKLSSAPAYVHPYSGTRAVRGTGLISRVDILFRIHDSTDSSNINPHGWLPHCRPDGLRWQGIAQRGWAAGDCRCVRMRWGLDTILIQATEGTEDTEKWKNTLRTQRPLRF
ncbi:MAG: hypothetical protein MIO93_03000 [ANME-2 cluster archaeon]|nr:hypothetical protein [ANME-2 cluster archaeon]